MNGQCLQWGFNPRKDREIFKTASGGVKWRFAFNPVFQKEGFMNKRIVAISILMLMMCAMAVYVFAETNYQVVVVYETRGVRDRKTGAYITHPKKEEVTVTVTASSVSEAETKGRDLVRAQKDPGRIISANAVRL
jgi:hypothetical protein